MEIGALVREFFVAAGPGGVVVVSVILGASVVYFLLTRWILGEKPASPPELTAQDLTEQL
jgi:hypothetical protein